VWVFVTEAGTPLDESKVRKVMRAVLEVAKLPLHYSPHCFRHTYASLLLQAGVSPAYVQKQLGHASITLTVDTYGRWLPMGNKAAVDGLDDRPSATVGNQLVAAVVAKRPESNNLQIVNPEVPGFVGGPRRTRTCDPLIKSQLLYQLS